MNPLPDRPTTTEDDPRLLRAAQEYLVNRESIRYRQASFVEHLFVRKDNPLKLEILHLVRTAQALRDGTPVEPGDADDLRSLAVALAVERMIRDGVVSETWPQESPWSAPSR